MASRIIVAEPPAPYGGRPPLVIDCSALAVMIFREPDADIVESRLAGHRLHAPHLLQAELAKVALVKHRRGESHALAALRPAGELAIDLHPLDIPAVVELAERHGLTAYDSAYLWLAAQLQCPLLTFDRKLGVAARRYFSGQG